MKILYVECKISVPLFDSMRKTLLTLGFLCAVVILSAQTEVLEKRIDFACKNKPLKEALDKLKRKSGLRLSYADHTLEGKRVTVKVKNQKVKNILNILLRKHALTYENSGRQVVITRKKLPTRTYQRYTISGIVKDDETGTELPLANILIDGQRPRTTNKDGEIYLRLQPTDSVCVQIAYPGYEKQDVTFRVHCDTFLSIRLVTDNELLPEINVIGRKGRVAPVDQEAAVGTGDISVLNSFRESSDLMKSIQLLPGIQSGNEGFSSLYVRGGSADQNLVLLDGAPIYNPSHMAGIFSIFNENIIGDVALYKNELPARYGGRLSSVLDIGVREGNMREHKVRGSMGLLASNLTIEGPLRAGKTSFLLAFRRTWLDMLVRPLSRSWLNESFEVDGNRIATNGEAQYAFYDINAKISHRFSEKDRLSFSIYNGGDNFSFIDNLNEEKINQSLESERVTSSFWGNLTASLQWTHIFPRKMILHTSASFTDFEFDYFNKYAYLQTENDSLTGGRLFQNYTSDIQDIALNTELKYTPSDKHRFRVGAQVVQHRFRPGINSVTEENIRTLEQLEIEFDNPLIKTWEAAGYVQSQHRMGGLRLHTGLRAGFLLHNNNLFSTFEPRLALNALLTDYFSLRSTYTHTTQHLHLLTNSGIELPTDLWVPASKFAPPEQSQQAGIGGIYSDEDLTVSLDFYHKKMDNLIAFQGENAVILSGRDWEEKVESGRGWAYGGEAVFMKKTGKTTGVFAYTLSWSYRQFDNINEGVAYPFKYDRRHDVSLAMRHELSERVALKSDWVYGSGNPFTRPIREAPLASDFPSGSPATVYIYEPKNASRMPSFHRLNIGAEWKGKQKEGYTWTMDFGVYNIYNRKNPFLLYIGPQENTEENEYKQLSLFPILPYISYNFKF